MDRRLELHEQLVSILGSPYVYFQPPANIKLNYPCIIYSIQSKQHRFANDAAYKNKTQYKVTVIDREPDSLLPDALFNSFRYCGFDRSYTADDLNHSVLTLYY